MRSKWLVVSSGVVLSAVLAAAGQPIRPPEVKPVAPPPQPAGAVDDLPPDTLYAVECDVPCLLLASPQGLVNVSEHAGPVTVFGKFVGGAGASELRTLKGKQVFLVTGVQPGAVELLVVPAGATKAADVVRRTVNVKAGVGPQPPPKPVDPKPVEPNPTLPDAPDNVTRVLILFDPGQLSAQTEARKAVPYGAATRDYLKGVVGADGLRVYEAGVQFPPNSASPWKSLVARGIKAGQFGSVVITRGGKVVSETDIPATPEAALELFRKHLGN